MLLIIYGQWLGIMKNLEAPDFSVHTYFAVKLSVIQGRFHISGLILGLRDVVTK